jgi:hypothetical protein
MKRAVTFRLHIDHIDNRDGDVWAVSYGKTYRTAHRFELVGLPRVWGGEVRARQPRAFMSGRGRVSVVTRAGKRTIVIEGRGAP